jgi:hypothetical protein
MAPHADVGAGTMNGFSITNGTLTPPEFIHNQKETFIVNSPDVQYSADQIRSKYVYRTTTVSKSGGYYVASPKETTYDFRVDRKVGKTGLMLVGLGGNNGTTVTGGILANRRNLTFETKEGPRPSNYYGSLVMSSTMKLGTDAISNEEVNIPFHDVLPMVHPNDLVIGGWDISSMNLADAMDRASVLEPDLKRQLRKEMALMTPLKSIYYPDFIAANQEDRADHILEGSKACMAHVEQLRTDIRYVVPPGLIFASTSDLLVVISNATTTWTRSSSSGPPTPRDSPRSFPASTTLQTTCSRQSSKATRKFPHPRSSLSLASSRRLRSSTALLRTPSFLVRYSSLNSTTLSSEEMTSSLARPR